MFLITVRKMLSNRWFLLCTMLGSIITVALLSSIPTYTDGIMQRMLIKDLEKSYQETGIFPGGYEFNFDSLSLAKNDKTYETFKGYDNTIKTQISKSIDLPILAQVTFEKTGTYSIANNDSGKNSSASLSSLSDLENHIKLISGSMYSKSIENGVYEVILSEQGMRDLNVTLGKTYNLLNKTRASETTYKIKVVGIFTYKTLDDPYWFKDIGKYNTSIFMDQQLMNKTLFEGLKQPISASAWYFAYDYHKLKVNMLESMVEVFGRHNQWISKNAVSGKRPAESIIKQNLERSSQLKTTLIVLQCPVLVLLAFYLFMVSKLKIGFESNEIAIIKSRGGSNLLIFGIYLIESALIGLVSIIIGPILGLLICKVLGSSDGFLSFVQRAALPLKLSLNSYIFSLAAVIFICVSMLIPAIAASRTTIVLYKQKNARRKKTSFWKKYFLDILLLAVAFYGLYGYKRHQKILFTSGMKSTEMVIDPLLFVVSVLFIFGLGLVFLRIFPYIVMFIFWLGKKIWNPVLYTSFIQVGRTTGWEQFTMLFIIIALSIGIFSSNSARTINRNMEDKIHYTIGADTVIKGHWKDNQPPFNPYMVGPDLRKKDAIYYYEPPFELYEGLSGAQSVTKVFKTEDSVAMYGGKMIDQITLMGIIPHEFGKTAWFRNDLLPYHWFQYLNLLTDNPSAVLVSKAFKDKLGAKEGDKLDILWSDNSCSISSTIFAFIDYWPTLNPNKITDIGQNPYFIVGNLNYFQDMNLVEPYQVWIKRKPEITANDLNKEIIAKKIEIDSIIDSSQEVIDKKNDAMLQGTNGSLTLSFITILIITVIGFLIYWIIAIKRRILQFGIFRAMGLTTGEVIGMIAVEQLLITGSSIFAGIELGNLTSKIFVPLLQIIYSSDQQVPPFKIISEVSDYLRLYIIIAFMLVICFIIIGRIISKINISQALKLGED